MINNNEYNYFHKKSRTPNGKMSDYYERKVKSINLNDWKGI